MIMSGTHALTLALFGILRPGDTFLSIAGDLYDTLYDVIYGKNIGSLADFNINFDKIDLKNGAFDEENIIKTIEKTRPKMVFIQRSRGYSWRDALSIDAISDIIRKIRQKIRILSLPSTTVTASLSIILNRQTSARTLS